jgi:hypothetical protein
MLNSVSSVGLYLDQFKRKYRILYRVFEIVSQDSLALHIQDGSKVISYFKVPTESCAAAREAPYGKWLLAHPVLKNVDYRLIFFLRPLIHPQGSLKNDVMDTLDQLKFGILGHFLKAFVAQYSLHDLITL